MNIKYMDNALQRFTKAHTLSGKTKKKDMEKDLENSIKRAKKLKFFIEKEIYSKEASQKY